MPKEACGWITFDKSQPFVQVLKQLSYKTVWGVAIKIIQEMILWSSRLQHRAYDIYIWYNTKPISVEVLDLGTGRACSRARSMGWGNDWLGRARAREWRAWPKIFRICPCGRGPGSCHLRAGSCFLLFFWIFDSFRLKNKGKERSAHGPSRQARAGAGLK